MKRVFLGLLACVILILCFGNAAAASPLAGKGGGGLVIFGEYADDAYQFSQAQGYVLGLGYGLTKNLTVGLEAMQSEDELEQTWWLYGLYANVTLEAFLFNLDLLYEPEGGNFFGKLAGLYQIEFDPLSLAVGGGFFTDTSHEEVTLFLEGSAGLKLGEHFDLYGTADYALSSGDMTYKVGTSFNF